MGEYKQQILGEGQMIVRKNAGQKRGGVSNAAISLFLHPFLFLPGGLWGKYTYYRKLKIIISICFCIITTKSRNKYCDNCINVTPCLWVEHVANKHMPSPCSVHQTRVSVLPILSFKIVLSIPKPIQKHT